MVEPPPCGVPCDLAGGDLLELLEIPEKTDADANVNADVDEARMEGAGAVWEEHIQREPDATWQRRRWHMRRPRRSCRGVAAKGRRGGGASVWRMKTDILSSGFALSCSGVSSNASARSFAVTSDTNGHRAQQSTRMVGGPEARPMGTGGDRALWRGTRTTRTTRERT